MYKYLLILVYETYLPTHQIKQSSSEQNLLILFFCIISNHLFELKLDRNVILLIWKYLGLFFYIMQYCHYQSETLLFIMSGLL